MKKLGTIRNIDSLGRVVLPVEVRRRMRLTAGTPVEMYTDGDKMVLKKYDIMTDTAEYLDSVKTFIQQDGALPGEVAAKLLSKLDEMMGILDSGEKDHVEAD